MAIHPTAIIDRAAELHPTVEVGPYAVIDGPVRIGADTKVWNHAFITSWTRIGERCQIHPFAVIGHLPQDFHFTGERSYLTIGNDVVIREGSSIHRGSQAESETVIGDECFLMAQTHVGHNCVLGRAVKLMPFAGVAGHVKIDDLATLSASALIHQFVRIGKLAFVAAACRVTMDIPPFMMAHGESLIVQHNRVGMQRSGYNSDELLDIRNAYRTLYRTELTFRKAVEQLEQTVRTRAGRELLAFLQAESRRGISLGGGHRTRIGRGSAADESA